ncbi:MAG: protein-tyrosine-phosphatase [Bacteroidia bacterium]
MTNTHPDIFPKIQRFIESLNTEPVQLSPDRKNRLTQIAEFIQQQTSKGKPAELIFICTHNSRRSHFGQIWAKVLADYYGLSSVYTYSGGTEATAFNPNAIEALRSVGFQIEVKDEGENPHYEIRYAENLPSLKAWSKVYSDPANPQQDFCAVMTCSEADEACPAVFGARRVSLPFEDPKKADGTPQEAETYLERCRQIAQEILFVMHSVKEQNTPR